LLAGVSLTVVPLTAVSLTVSSLTGFSLTGSALTASSPAAPRLPQEIAMEVILREDVSNLGHRGDVVKVAEGYGRNFLLPKNLAMEATPANKAVIDQMKASAVRRSAKEKAEAEQLVTQLNTVSLVFERRVGDHEQLFGSVTSSDIAQGLAAKGFEIDRRKVQLEEPLKSTGEFHIPVKLHREVTAHIAVTVKGEEAQAE
jgi:large subunit ribosomal protein L9